jgi:RND family efflux transporter MFP subunit
MQQLEISSTLAGPSPASVAFALAQVAKARVELDRVKLEAARNISDTAHKADLAKLGGVSPELFAAEVHLDRAKAVVAEAQEAYNKALDRPWEDQSIRENLAQELHYAQLDQRLAEVEVEAAKAALAEQALRTRHAQEGLERVAELEEQQVATAQADLTLAQAQLDQLVAPPRAEDLAVLQTQVSRAEEHLARLQARLAETRLYAPFDGTILSLEAGVGDPIKAYAPVGAVGDPSDLQVLAFVFEENVDAIAYDLPVTVVLDSDLDSVHPAHVQQVASQPVTWQGKTAYEVTITFDEPAHVPAVMRTGCDVYVQPDTRSDRLFIPSSALRTVGGLTYVDVVKDGVVSQTLVQVGASGGDRAEIISGLQEGQAIRVY